MCRTAHAQRDLFNVPVSTGTILSFIHGAAGALTLTFDQISQAILAEAVVHFDEAGMRVEA
ncbi:IS66 family transposase [Cupriavidus necator]